MRANRSHTRACLYLWRDGEDALQYIEVCIKEAADMIKHPRAVHRFGSPPHLIAIKTEVATWRTLYYDSTASKCPLYWCREGFEVEALP